MSNSALFRVGDRVVAKFRYVNLAEFHGVVIACYSALPNVGKRGCGVRWDGIGRGLPAEDQLEFESPSIELLAREGVS